MAVVRAGQQQAAVGADQPAVEGSGDFFWQILGSEKGRSVSSSLVGYAVNKMD